MKLIKLAVALVSCAFLASCDGLYSDEPLLDRSLASLPFGAEFAFRYPAREMTKSAESTNETEEPIPGIRMKAVDNSYEGDLQDAGVMRLHFYEVEKLGEEFRPLLATKLNYIIEVDSGRASEYLAAQIYNKDVKLFEPKPSEEQIEKILNQGGAISINRSKHYTSFSVKSVESLGHVMSVTGTESKAENLGIIIITD